MSDENPKLLLYYSLALSWNPNLGGVGESVRNGLVNPNAPEVLPDPHNWRLTSFVTSPIPNL